MICFCYFCKKIVFCFGNGSHGDPFLQKSGQKIVIFRSFSKDFSELQDSKLLRSIESLLNIFQFSLETKVGVVLGQLKPN